MTNTVTFSFRKPIIITNLKTGIGLLLFWTLVGVYFTSLSSVLLKMQGVHTNWFHLSLNYFSRAWIWVLLTPVVYKLYRYLFYSSLKNYNKIIFSLVLGSVIAFVHVFSSLYFDILLRNWLNIIEIDFWSSLISEIPLVIKYLSNSFITYIFLVALIVGNDHFGFIKRFVLLKEPHEEKIYRSITESVPQKAQNTLIVKSEGKIRFLESSHIRAIEAKGNYVLIRLQNEQVLVRTTLTAMHVQLNESNFFRINRSVIVNREYIKELEPWFNGEYILRMKEGQHFKTGRTYKEQLQLLLKRDVSK